MQIISGSIIKLHFRYVHETRRCLDCLDKGGGVVIELFHNVGSKQRTTTESWRICFLMRNNNWLTANIHTCRAGLQDHFCCQIFCVFVFRLYTLTDLDSQKFLQLYQYFLFVVLA